MRIAIDYDKTLTRPDVYNYVQELINIGLDIWIVTFRYDDDNFHKYKGKYGDLGNSDLWEDATKLGIKNKVVFTNHTSKANILNKMGDFYFILDDDKSVMADITANSKVTPIQVASPKYKHKLTKGIYKSLSRIKSVMLCEVVKFKIRNAQ